MRIYVEDGLSFENLDFDFAARRLAQIVGVKPDGGSNGAGKSNFIDCLSLALYGESSRGIPQTELVRDGATSSALFQAEWDRYRVERRFSPKESAKFFVDDVDQRCYSLADVQQKVNEAFMDQKMFTSCVFYAQDQTEFFVNTADSKQKGLLENILRFHRYSAAQIRAKVRVKQLEDLVRGLPLAQRQAQLEQATADLAGLKERVKEEEEAVEIEKEDIKEKLREVEDSFQPVGVLQTQVDILKQEIAESMEEDRETERELISEQGRIRQLEQDSGRFESTLSNASKNLEKERSALDSLKKKVGKPCPTCGVPMKQSSLQKALTQKETAIAELEQEAKVAERSLTANKAAVHDSSVKIQRLTKGLASLQALRESLSSAQARLQEAENWNKVQASSKARLEARLHQLAQPSNLEDLLVEKVHQIRRLEKELASLEEDRNGFLEELKLYTFWVEGFGNTGIKSLLLDQHSAFINSRVNHYLEELTHGDIRAKFSSQTRLKSEELRDKISFTIWVYGKPHDYKTYSGGQKTLINLAAIFALRDLSREQGVHYPLLILDETFKELDPLYSTAVMSLLRSMAKTEHIYVVSHNDSLRDFITDTVTIRLGTDKVSRMEV